MLLSEIKNWLAGLKPSRTIVIRTKDFDYSVKKIEREGEHKVIIYVGEDIESE